jgi:NADPH2 dehydrogenase
MNSTLLFSPYRIKGLTCKNRIAMAPMCQYSAKQDGLPQEWHRLHYATRAVGQVGLMIIEATAVEPRGRISDKDLGLWSDEAIEPFAAMLQAVKAQHCRVGIQIAHAGRKASIDNEPTVSPSAIRFSDQLPLPVELTPAEIKKIVSAFAAAVRRAVQAGADFIEIHAAHGYLINQFLSPLTNHRRDAYGTDRSLFLREILEAVAQFAPKEMPIFVRVSAEEHHKGGNHPEDLCRLLEQVSDLIDLVHVSSGGVVAEAVVEMFPGYQLSFAETIKRTLNIDVMAVGMLDSPELAEQTLQAGRADLIALGRELLRNPYWPLHAARSLNVDIDWPTAYERAKIK